MTRIPLTLELLEEIYGVCRLDPRATIPRWACQGRFTSLTRTPDELSIVCCEKSIPAGVEYEGKWRCMGIEGPLDFNLVGILSALPRPLPGRGSACLPCQPTIRIMFW